MVDNNDNEIAKTLGTVWHEMETNIRAQAAGANPEQIATTLNSMKTCIALGANTVLEQILAEILKMPAPIKAACLASFGPLRGQFEAFRDDVEREGERLHRARMPVPTGPRLVP